MLPAMRARRTRASLCAAALLVAPLTSCTKNAKTKVELAGEGSGAEPARPGGLESDGAPVDRGPIEKIHVSASLADLGDMLDAASKLVDMWVPREPGAPPADLRAIVSVGLIQEGFGPGFFESLNLDGVHAMQLGFPHEGQANVTGADIDLALALSTIDAKRALDSMPAELRPQPQGQNLWVLVEEDMQLFFRPEADALEVALKVQDLDVAHGLRGQVAVGADEPRVKVQADNIPPVDIDVSDLIPLPARLARTLGSIINETKSVEFGLDFGLDRDLIVRTGAAAPFGRLGLDPIGPATQTPSALAKTLPPDAMLTWVMPWGDPALLHGVLDKQIPVDAIPAPFNKYVAEVVSGTHGVLDQIRAEVLAAAYIEKGQFTLVLAGEVKDEAKAREAMRAVFEAAKKAFGDHIALVGSSPDHSYKVAFKKDAISAGKAKGDLFTVTIPKDMQDSDAGWLVGAKKPQLEVAMIVADGKLVVAIGAGQKTLMRDLGRRLTKQPDDGLEAGGGLALARKLAHGCQYCLALDPVELGEMVLTVIETDSSEPKEVRAAAKAARTKLLGLGLEGEVALALRLDEAEGMFGGGVPKTLLFASADKIKTVVGLFESIEDAREAAWAQASTANP